MPRVSIPVWLRQFVVARAHDECEYCLIHQNDMVTRHNIDHIVSLKHSGSTEENNLALSCAECNYRKGTDIATIDPDSGQLVRLFNPRTDRWRDHFSIEGARIVGLTPSGRGTVQLLQINEPSRVKQRAYLQATNRYPAN